MSHHCIAWIPSDIVSRVNLLWTLDIPYLDIDVPKIWIEHGIPDNNVIKKRHFFNDIHYLCSNDWTYNILKNEGLSAYHTGHVYLDETIPKVRTPRFFVYVPQHCRSEASGFPIEWDHPIKTREELEYLANKYECEDFITSIVDDSEEDLYSDINPLKSNRYHDNGRLHFNKCRYLYETAKVIYTDMMSTFDIAAEAHGIPILGRELQLHPRAYDKISIHSDGKCKERILNTINEILRIS